LPLRDGGCVIDTLITAQDPERVLVALEEGLLTA
jgi:hypothetical protein